MKYKFILFSPWLLKSPVKVGALNPKAFGANLGLVGVASSVVVCCPCRVLFKVSFRGPARVQSGFHIMDFRRFS